MSAPIFPMAVWQSGTNQNSVPANDNALRDEILNGLVISESTDAQPGSPGRGDIYIMTGSATGTQWATFDQYDLAIFDGEGTWHAYAPVAGIVVNVAGVLKRWSGTAYVNVGGTSMLARPTSTSAIPVQPVSVGCSCRYSSAASPTADAFTRSGTSLLTRTTSRPSAE